MRNLWKGLVGMWTEYKEKILPLKTRGERL